MARVFEAAGTWEDQDVTVFFDDREDVFGGWGFENVEGDVAKIDNMHDALAAVTDLAPTITALRNHATSLRDSLVTRLQASSPAEMVDSHDEWIRLEQASHYVIAAQNRQNFRQEQVAPPDDEEQP